METRFHSLSLMVGGLVGVLVGATLGAFAGWERAQAEPSATPPVVAPLPRPDVPTPSDTRWPHISYAQQGEDIVVRTIFDALKIPKPSYIDIGAYHPQVNNNTYLFYRAGGRGVLVEPNPAFGDMLRAKRPGDRVLPIGIGTKDVAADYYVFQGPGQDNTFSKEQADELVRRHGKDAIRAVIKIPLRTINGVLTEQFPSGAPDFFSIDIEGMDLDVLRTLDFEKHRPKVFCVETTAVGVDQAKDEIGALMKKNGYVARGGNLVNTIFVDGRLALP